jgi:hypothetical protein
MRKSRSGLECVWGRVVSAWILSVAFAAIAVAQGGPTQAMPGRASKDAPPANDGTRQIPSGPQIRIQSNLVTAPVTVIDKHTGEFVFDLKESDFEILDNGKPQQITGFSRESHKISAVILV